VTLERLEQLKNAIKTKMALDQDSHD